MKAVRPVCLNCGPLPPNKVGKIAQHTRKGEGRIEGKNGIGIDSRYCYIIVLP
jgi:hypothetical protein